MRWRYQHPRGDTNVYQYVFEDDLSLTSAELEKGLTRFAGYLPERAPVLQNQLSSITKKLRSIYS